METKKRKGQYMPFNALEGFKDSLQEVEKEMEREAKKQYFEEKEEELSQKLFLVLENKMEAEFLYHVNGQKESLKEEVEKLNEDTKELIFKSGKRLKIDTIYEIIL